MGSPDPQGSPGGGVRQRSGRRLRAVLASCVAATALSACGGAHNNDTGQARAVALLYLRAAGTDNAGGLCSALSSAAQSEIEIGGTCEQVLAGGLAGFDGAKERFLMTTLRVTVSGSTGRASVSFTGARSGVFEFPLIRQGGVWAVASALTWR